MKRGIVAGLALSAVLLVQTSLASAAGAAEDHGDDAVRPLAVPSCPLPDGKWPAPQVTVTKSQADVYISGSLRARGTGPATLTISQGRTTTTTGTVSASVRAEAGVIFAKASAEVGGSLSRSTTTSTTTSYSVNVPAGRTVEIEAGSHGVGFKTVVRKYLSTCRWATYNGTAAFPRSTGTVWYIHRYVA